MPLGSYWRPRAIAALSVPVMGAAADRESQAQSTDVVSFPVRVLRASWERNDHNAADALEIDVDYSEAGSDPRLLTNAEVAFWMSPADVRGQWTPGDDNLRFLGIVTNIERHLAEGDRRVRIRALDYTTLFLRSKPFPSSGVPAYTDSLATAWRKICDATGAWDVVNAKLVSTVQRLVNRLEFRGVDPDTQLGKAVPKRFASFGKVQTQPSDDAWAVWQRCVGMLGLISWVDRDRIVVSTATDYYTASRPPRLIWGKNVLELDEDRDVDSLSGKGVCLTSFDPVTGTTLEAFYPPREDFADVRKQVVASGGKQKQAVVSTREYEIFSYPEVTDAAALLECARRVYEERSRQELHGTVKTTELAAPTPDSTDERAFDLLSLGAGDRVRVELEQDALSGLLRLPTEAQRIDYLTQRGYADGVSTLMARNVAGLGSAVPEFQVRNVRGEYETTPEGGSVHVTIGYVNRINIDGNAG